MTAILAVALQSPLIFNPGYFGADELQWWARADVPWSQLPWVSWRDLQVFQYRPLTFNLWLVLAHALAANAYAMHAVFVMIGTINALLIAATLHSMGVARPTATVAALVFVCSPFVAYTHGWTGTLADLLVLLFGLLAFAALRMLHGETSAIRLACVAFGVALLQALALAAKESAIVLPLLMLCAAISHETPRRVAAIAGVAGAIVSLYLALRLQTLLGSNASGYAWQLSDVPGRLAEYLLYPWLPSLFEIGPSLEKSAWRIAIAVTCLAGLVFALARSGWRHAAAFVVLYAGMLAPVLVLERSCNQYAYLASAAAVGVVAYAWRSATQVSKALILATASIVCLHGAGVAMRMREIGVIEVRFHDTLADLLAAQSSTFAIAPARPSDTWLLRRFTDGVPNYRGIVFTGRVFTANAPDGSIHATMASDGSLSLAPTGEPAR